MNSVSLKLGGENPAVPETGTPMTLLSLRDQFAMAALPACIDMQRRDTREQLEIDERNDAIEPGLPFDAEDDSLSEVATAAYLFADAMLKARTASLG